MKRAMQKYPGGKKKKKKIRNANEVSQSCSMQSIVSWIILGNKTPSWPLGFLSCLCFELDHNLEQGYPVDVSAMMEIFCILNTLPGPIWQPRPQVATKHATSVASETKELTFKFYFNSFKVKQPRGLVATVSDSRVLDFRCLHAWRDVLTFSATADT